METPDTTALRNALGLTQTELGMLLGVHAMTVSKWERGKAHPTSYQQALLEQFQRAAQLKQARVQENLKTILITAGVVAALLILLQAASRS